MTPMMTTMSQGQAADWTRQSLPTWTLRRQPSSAARQRSSRWPPWPESHAVSSFQPVQPPPGSDQVNEASARALLQRERSASRRCYSSTRRRHPLQPMPCCCCCCPPRDGRQMCRFRCWRCRFLLLLQTSGRGRPTGRSADPLTCLHHFASPKAGLRDPWTRAMPCCPRRRGLPGSARLRRQPRRFRGTRDAARQQYHHQRA